MFTDEELTDRCHTILDLIEALCIELADGRLQMADFTRRILTIESELISKAGLILVASNTSEDWMHFAVQARRSSRIRESFEFNPKTAEFRGELESLGGVMEPPELESDFSTLGPGGHLNELTNVSNLSPSEP